MNGAEPTPADEPDEPQNGNTDSDAAASPRADLHDAIGWVILGLAIAIGSWQMDRLADRHINPFTIPGLVPGLLGAGMVILGVILGIRSWSRGGHRQGIAQLTANQRERRKRASLAVILCCGYSIVLIGHGLPFWVASWIYVTGAILAFDRISPDPAKRRIGLAGVAKALLIGIVSSVVVWMVFERLFLVRLP